MFLLLRLSNTSGKKRKFFFVDSDKVESKPKPTKSQATKNSSTTDPPTATVVDDLPNPHAQDEFYLQSDLENEDNDEEAKHKSSDKVQDDDDSDRDNGLLEGDNVDFDPLLSSDDEHPFNTMSSILGGDMLKDGTDPIEFRVGMVLKNMKSFTWAFQDFCIQEMF